MALKSNTKIAKKQTQKTQKTNTQKNIPTIQNKTLAPFALRVLSEKNHTVQ